MSEDRKVPVPEPYPWGRPITLEEYEAFVPDRLDLVEGYLIDGPGAPERRLALLALLVANCGLEAAIFAAHRDYLREAVEATHGSLYE